MTVLVGIHTPDYLLPGLIAGVLARSGGSLFGSNASTLSEIRLANGTPKFTVAVRAVHDRRRAENGSAVGADDVQCLLHPAAFGHHVLDDQDLFSGRNLESAPQDQFAVLFFHKNEPHAKLPRDFLADDQSAHRRRHDRDRAEAI